MVANAVRHAPGPIGISVSWEGTEAVLFISDRGPGIPPVRRTAAPDAESGRGLQLIQALARNVAIEAVPGRGTRIIVHLPVRRERASARR